MRFVQGTVKKARKLRDMDLESVLGSNDDKPPKSNDGPAPATETLASKFEAAASSSVARFSEQARPGFWRTGDFGPLHPSADVASGDHSDVDAITSAPSLCTDLPLQSSQRTTAFKNIPSRPQPAHITPSSKHYSSLSSPSAVTLNECCAPRSAPAPPSKRKMGLSKTQRIAILLGIDSVFFIIELTIGERLLKTPHVQEYI
jgi:hypothetical protein